MKRTVQVLGPSVLYLAMAAALGFQEPGLQYDEALLMSGAVQMLHGPAHPAIQHHPAAAVNAGGRWLPVMVAPYVGAVKDYLLLPVFAVFGINIVAARCTAALLGAIGILGLAAFVRGHVSRAWAAPWLLAIHPAYLDQIIYDNGALAAMMAVAGLALLALGAYLRRPGSIRAALLGCTAGLLVYARLNAAWLVISATAAAAMVWRRGFAAPLKHWVALAGGGLIGVAPLIWYELASNWQTLRFVSREQISAGWIELWIYRLDLLSNVLLSDADRRGIWGGPELAAWQRAFVCGLLGASVLICLRSKERWSRAAAFTFLGLAALLMLTRLPVGEHHLLTLVPVAAVVCSLALAPRRRLAITAAVVYVGLALYWDFAFARGARETGGQGAWSDAIHWVRDYWLAHYANEELYILDWGFRLNLYVSSGGTIRSTELFWATPPTKLQPCRHYLIGAGGQAHFKAAAASFRRDLEELAPLYRRIVFYDRKQGPYAELYLHGCGIMAGG
ncbi:MAG: hypothetical protein HYS04_10120 [Acidobacteria bacterium]|nr:hypothetical protein [Acidobacteriota bacterium]